MTTSMHLTAFDPSLELAPAVERHPMSRPARMAPEVYRRRRLAAVALVVGLVLGLASFGRQADAGPTDEARAAESVLVVVESGDTLWTIAESLTDGGADPRPLVSALTEIAGGGAIQPGQLLEIPGHLVD